MRKIPVYVVRLSSGATFFVLSIATFLNGWDITGDGLVLLLLSTWIFMLSISME